MPLTRESRQRFVTGADGFCKGNHMAVTEFCLCPALFAGGAAADIPGFHLLRSSQSVGSGFACAHHCYERKQILPPWLAQVSPSFSASTAPFSLPSSPAMNASAAPEANTRELAGGWSTLLADATQDVQVPVVEVPVVEEAPVRAAQLFLSQCGDIPKDIPVAMLDISMLRRQAETWHRLLPRVAPFYAVKCNPHPTIVSTLWDMWQEIGHGGFDCASPSEMKLVLPLAGLKPAEHIVYANPCKQISAVEFSRDIGVKRLVFDNVAELHKLKDVYPHTELLLRVQTDDSLAQCPLSNKFGAAPADCKGLLSKAHELGMKVVGVSFHVGSGCSQPGAFRGALQRARDVYDEAERLGMEFTCLDIGGGFPGWDEPEQAIFADHAADICEMLETLFPSPSVKVIAEPGRYFAATSQALLTSVVSVAETSSGCRYYLNDGVYGSFNCLFYDHASVPHPQILRDGQVLQDQANAELATVFGPTCDGLDLLTDSIRLPRLKVDDRLLFANMGAYTSAASSTFNGFAPATTFVYESKTTS
jgi:ornithine decarboxylase